MISALRCLTTFAAVLFCLVATTPVNAAKIALGKKVGDVQFVSLEGQIEKGDAKRLAETIAPIARKHEASGSFVQFRLTLNSPGGVLSEAIKISEFLKEQGIQTLIPDRADCLSACAIIFMHGSTASDISDSANRTLSINSKLGFHAPYIRSSLEDGAYDKRYVVGAYNTALNLIKLVIKEQQIRSDLLLKMLEADQNQMFYVDKIWMLEHWKLDLAVRNTLIRVDSSQQDEIADLKLPRDASFFRRNMANIIFPCLNHVMHKFKQTKRDNRIPYEELEPDINFVAKYEEGFTWMETEWKPKTAKIAVSGIKVAEGTKRARALVASVANARQMDELKETPDWAATGYFYLWGQGDYAACTVFSARNSTHSPKATLFWFMNNELGKKELFQFSDFFAPNASFGDALKLIGK